MSLYQQVFLLFVYGMRWFYSDLYELQELSIFNKPVLYAWTKSVYVLVWVKAVTGLNSAAKLTMAMSAEGTPHHTHILAQGHKWGL